MKVLVCGGRNFRSPAQVFRALDRLHQEKPITELMQGGATGADQFAMKWAATKRYVCHADWETHGRAAGPIRNEKMLTWKPDLVVAFPGGDGTADMVRRAEAAGVPVQRFEARNEARTDQEASGAIAATDRHSTACQYWTHRRPP
jgi:hypothetical protein